MEGLLKKYFKHALKCEQCSEHPENPCAIGVIILSAAASAAIISAQQERVPDIATSRPETIATKQNILAALEKLRDPQRR